MPLDYYAEPQGEPSELAIALLKVPANMSTSDPAYRGSILINPGGPGGSGVDAALAYGLAVQSIIGDDFDIIGFDPRGKYSIVVHHTGQLLMAHAGVSRTTPGIDAFRGANLQRQVWGIRDLGAPTLNDSAEALPWTIATQRLYNTLLADKAADVAPYVGTAATARDMLSIIDALGQGSLLEVVG